MTDTPAAFKVPPVEKSVTVACAPARAFAAFTAEIGQWWPLATHSVGQAQARKVVIEPAIGGRVYEICANGAEHDWGRVLQWTPPQVFAMSWHPGRAADTQQVLEVRFSAEGSGTRVALVHRGWEILGAEAQARRDNYEGGWTRILSGDFATYLRNAGRG